MPSLISRLGANKHVHAWRQVLVELLYISRVQFLFSLMDYQASFWECSGGNIPPVAMVLGCHGESCVCVCVGKACASKVFYWFCLEGGILLGLPDVQFVIMGKYFTASQSCQVERMFAEGGQFLWKLSSGCFICEYLKRKWLLRQRGGERK